MPRSFSERNSLPSPPGAQLPRASIQAEYGQRGLASPYPLNPGSFRLQPVLGGLMDVFEESARYDHHPVAITHDQVTGRYRHPAALDRLSDPAMPTLVGPGHACSAGKDRQFLFSKLIDIPDGSIDDHAPNPRNLGGYGEYFRSEARSFVHRSPVRTSNNALPLVGYPQ